MTQLPIEYERIESVPSIQRQGKASKSEPVIRAFIESGDTAWKLSTGDVKPQSVKASLKRYILNNKLDNRVEVVTRVGQVYLQNLEKKVADTNGVE